MFNIHIKHMLCILTFVFLNMCLTCMWTFFLCTDGRPCRTPLTLTQTWIREPWLTEWPESNGRGTSSADCRGSRPSSFTYYYTQCNELWSIMFLTRPSVSQTVSQSVSPVFLVSAIPLKPLNRISWNLVVMKDIMCRCAYPCGYVSLLTPSFIYI